MLIMNRDIEVYIVITGLIDHGVKIQMNSLMSKDIDLKKLFSLAEKSQKKGLNSCKISMASIKNPL